DQADKGRILPIRTVRGPLDSARILDVKNRDDLSRGILAWSQAAGVPRLFLFPNQEFWTLAAFEDRDHELKPGWNYMMHEYSIYGVKTRSGLTKTAMPTGPLPPGVEPLPSSAIGQQPPLPSRVPKEPAPRK